LPNCSEYDEHFYEYLIFFLRFLNVLWSKILKETYYLTNKHMNSPTDFNRGFNCVEGSDAHVIEPSIASAERGHGGFLNKMRRTIGDRLLGATLVFATAAGCGGKVEESDTTTTGNLPGTIEFTTKDSVQGLLSGTFESEGHKINFEVARREANPTEELGPNTPLYAIDGRICDEKKFCFASQAGGHAFADPNWVPDDNEENGPDDKDAIKNFKTAWDLHQKLAESNIGDFAGLTEEFQALGNISNEPPEKWVISQSEESTPDANQEMPQKDVSVARVAATNTYSHHFAMHKEQLYSPLVQDAWHSASRTRVIASNGSVYRVYQTCNHGSCAVSIPMYCARNFYNRPKTIPTNTSCAVSADNGTTHPTGYTGCCMSPYSWSNSDNAAHDCNDDTHLQRDIMTAGSASSVNQSYCSDKTAAWQPPECI
jgi:hypothetical protein